MLITTPFWPVHLDREMLEKASSLKLVLTAGVGSDHIDLKAAAELVDGRWDIGEIPQRSWDLESNTIGIYGAGAIGQLIALRLKPFGVRVLYYKRSRLEHPEEAVIGARWAWLDEMQQHCDAEVITAPLTPETERLFDAGNPIEKDHVIVADGEIVGGAYAAAYAG